jgi:hypothetical protein
MSSSQCILWRKKILFNINTKKNSFDGKFEKKLILDLEKATEASIMFSEKGFLCFFGSTPMHRFY